MTHRKRAEGGLNDEQRRQTVMELREELDLMTNDSTWSDHVPPRHSVRHSRTPAERRPVEPSADEVAYRFKALQGLVLSVHPGASEKLFAQLKRKMSNFPAVLHTLLQSHRDRRQQHEQVAKSLQAERDMRHEIEAQVDDLRQEVTDWREKLRDANRKVAEQQAAVGTIKDDLEAEKEKHVRAQARYEAHLEQLSTRIGEQQNEITEGTHHFHRIEQIVEQQHAQRAQQRKEMDQLIAETASMRQERDAMRQEVDRRMKSAASSSGLATSLRDEIADLRDKLDEAEVGHHKVDTRNRMLADDKVQLHKELDAKKQQLDEMQKQLDGARHELAEWLQKDHEWRERLQQEEQKSELLDTHHQQFERELRQERLVTVELRTTVDKITRKLERALDDKMSAEKRMEESRNDMARAGERHEQMLSQTREQLVMVAQRKEQELLETIDMLKVQFREAEREYDAQLAEHIHKFQLLQTHKEHLEQARDDLKREHDKTSAMLETEQKEVHDLTAANSRLEQRVEALAQRKDELQVQVEKLSTQVAEGRTALDKHRESLEAKQQELTANEQELREARTRGVEALAQLRTKEREIAGLEAKVKGAEALKRDIDARDDHVQELQEQTTMLQGHLQKEMSERRAAEVKYHKYEENFNEVMKKDKEEFQALRALYEEARKACKSRDKKNKELKERLQNVSATLKQQKEEMEDKSAKLELRRQEEKKNLRNERMAFESRIRELTLKVDRKDAELERQEALVMKLSMDASRLKSENAMAMTQRVQAANLSSDNGYLFSQLSKQRDEVNHLYKLLAAAEAKLSKDKRLQAQRLLHGSPANVRAVTPRRNY